MLLAMMAKDLRVIAARHRTEAEMIDATREHLPPAKRTEARLRAATLRRKATELEMAAQRQEATGV